MITKDGNTTFKSFINEDKAYEFLNKFTLDEKMNFSCRVVDLDKNEILDGWDNLEELVFCKLKYNII